MWQNIPGYLVLAYAIAQYFRPVTWCKGYRYNKKCALYISFENSESKRTNAQLQNEVHRRWTQSDLSKVMDL